MQHDNTLTPLSKLDDYEVARDEPDVCGWKVKTADNQDCGKVKDLIVDTGTMQVRYLDVKLDKKTLKLSEERHVLIPLGGARLDDDHDDVLLSAMTGAQLAKLPPYKAGEQIVTEQKPPLHKDGAKQFYGKRGGTGDVKRMTLSEPAYR